MDTNVIIDFLGNKLTSKGEAFVEKIAPAISIIARIEILGWYGVSIEQLNKLLPFFDNSIIYHIYYNQESGKIAVVPVHGGKDLKKEPFWRSSNKLELTLTTNQIE